MPAADVVVLNHQGLDRWPRLSLLARNIPIREPVTVTARRIPRSEVPSGRDDRTIWLDRLWIELDDQVHAAIR
jgi:hypothetical protein